MKEYPITWHSIVHPLGADYVVCQEGRYPRAGKWPLLQVYQPHDFNEPYTRASVNLDDSCAPDEVAINDYGVNEGMLDALVAAKVVKPPHRFINSGHVRIPVCQLVAGRVA